MTEEERLVRQVAVAAMLEDEAEVAVDDPRSQGRRSDLIRILEGAREYRRQTIKAYADAMLPVA